jgi:hypothetical protein
MPDHDETKQHAGPAADAGEPQPQSQSQSQPQRVSRRTMLRGAAAAGAAGVAATALAGVAGPALAGASTRSQDQPLRDNETNDEVVVHVTNARAGKIDVFRGTSHVELTDRALAARLVRASR